MIPRTVAVMPIGYSARQKTNRTATDMESHDPDLKPKCLRYKKKGMTNPHVVAPSNAVNSTVGPSDRPAAIATPRDTTAMIPVRIKRTLNSFLPTGNSEPYINDIIERLMG